MAEVIYTRKNTDEELNNVEIQDGQIMYTKDGHVFMDFGTDRIPMQNTPDIVMSDSSTNSVQNKVIKEYVDDNITTINNKIDNGTIIWENPNPTDSFSAQTITLNKSLDNYDSYEIIFKQSTIGNRFYTTGRIPVGHGTILFYTGGERYYRATADIINGNTITFEDNYAVGTASLIDNSRTLPMYVIGYNTGLF